MQPLLLCLRLRERLLTNFWQSFLDICSLPCSELTVGNMPTFRVNLWEPYRETVWQRTRLLPRSSVACCAYRPHRSPYAGFITLTNASPRRVTMALQQNYTCFHIHVGHHLSRTCRPEAFCGASFTPLTELGMRRNSSFTHTHTHTLRGLSPRANYTYRSTSACRRS
jgi:hypothetical protein